MLSICSVSYTWPMYLSDGKLNRKIIALCSVFVRIDHVYFSSSNFIFEIKYDLSEVGVFLTFSSSVSQIGRAHDRYSVRVSDVLRI